MPYNHPEETDNYRQDLEYRYFTKKHSPPLRSLSLNKPITLRLRYEQ
jgi:hypothetical protein